MDIPLLHNLVILRPQSKNLVCRALMRLHDQILDVTQYDNGDLFLMLLALSQQELTIISAIGIEL
jgi:hypothetical protein